MTPSSSAVVPLDSRLLAHLVRIVSDSVFTVIQHFLLGSSQAVRDSLKISLIEAGDLSKVREWSPASGAFSNRVSSLTNASQAFLKGNVPLYTTGERR